MNREQLTKVRDALFNRGPVGPDTRKAYLEALAILDRAIAAPEQDPVAWATFDGEGSYDLRLYERNENYRDDYLKRNGDQYAGWVEPLYRHPAPQSAQPVAVYEGENAMGFEVVTPLVPIRVGTELYAAPPAPQSAQPISLEMVYDKIIEWSTAGKGSRRELARRMIALFSAPPSRKWQGLTDEEIDKCFETEVWSARRSYARAIESALRAKNTKEQA